MQGTADRTASTRRLSSRNQGLSAKGRNGHRGGTFRRPMARIVRRVIFATVYRIGNGSRCAVRLLDSCQMNWPPPGRFAVRRGRVHRLLRSIEHPISVGEHHEAHARSFSHTGRASRRKSRSKASGTSEHGWNARQRSRNEFARRSIARLKANRARRGGKEQTPSLRKCAGFFSGQESHPPRFDR